MADFKTLLIGAVAIMSASPAYAVSPQEMKDLTALFAGRYLHIWSSSNVSPVTGVPYMYGRTVLFYGKPYTHSDLQAEKRRAISRWPVRNYVHRPGTMRVICNAADKKCAAHSIIDFTVSNPGRGIHKSGSAKFHLDVSFAGQHPVIVYEGGSLNKRRSYERTEGNGY
ncbi:hypothetical protein [Methylobacterium sp. CM6257]